MANSPSVTVVTRLGCPRCVFRNAAAGPGWPAAISRSRSMKNDVSNSTTGTPRSGRRGLSGLDSGAASCGQHAGTPKLGKQLVQVLRRIVVPGRALGKNSPDDVPIGLTGSLLLPHQVKRLQDHAHRLQFHERKNTRGQTAGPATDHRIEPLPVRDGLERKLPPPDKFGLDSGRPQRSVPIC